MEKNEIFEVVGFREFLVEIKNEVSKEVGNDYKVDINHVVKNNSVELDSLIILKEKESITPNIYLNPFYERYRKGESINNMVEEIIHIYEDSRIKEKENISVPFELEELKSFIIYRLVNYDRNKKLLDGIPYIRFLDLAITFHYLVKNNEEGIGTIRITKEHMKNWGIDLESLKELAKANTPRLFPPVIKSMNDIILEIINKEIETKELVNKQINTMYHDQRQSIDDTLTIKSIGLNCDKTNTMYVLSNGKGINGASCLIYKDVIKNLSFELEADFYILPSSIHEIILVKDNGLLEKEGLKSMVFDVNKTQVPEEEILSDSVYYYSRELDAITMFH